MVRLMQRNVVFASCCFQHTVFASKQIPSTPPSPCGAFRASTVCNNPTLRRKSQDTETRRNVPEAAAEGQEELTRGLQSLECTGCQAAASIWKLLGIKVWSSLGFCWRALSSGDSPPTGAELSSRDGSLCWKVDIASLGS